MSRLVTPQKITKTQAANLKAQNPLSNCITLSPEDARRLAAEQKKRFEKMGFPNGNNGPGTD